MELKGVETALPVAPHRCTADVIVRREPPSSNYRGSVHVVSAASSKTLMTANIIGKGVDSLNVEPVRQLQSGKRLLVMHLGKAVQLVLN